MKKLLSAILMLILSVMLIPASLSQAQDPTNTPTNTQTQPATAAPLTNKDVVDMLKAGLTGDVVIAKIRSSASNFDTSPAALAELKTAGVPDAVMLVMVNPTVPATAKVVESMVDVPDGTQVEIKLTNAASGEDLKVGDIVDFTVVAPVQINGVTIFEKESAARAKITTAKRAGHWGKAGKLEWAMQDIMSVEGNRVPARFTQRHVGDSKGGTVAVAAVATTVFLGPLALFWGLKKGQPAIIPAGNRYAVFISGDTKIKGKSTQTASNAR